MWRGWGLCCFRVDMGAHATVSNSDGLNIFAHKSLLLNVKKPHTNPYFKYNLNYFIDIK